MTTISMTDKPSSAAPAANVRRVSLSRNFEIPPLAGKWIGEDLGYRVR